MQIRERKVMDTQRDIEDLEILRDGMIVADAVFMDCRGKRVALDMKFREEIALGLSLRIAKLKSA